MRKQQGRKIELTQSKYFSIESYFKSPPNKKAKIETEIPAVEAKKEKCPSCFALIHVESESMEVHVNNCLDSQQSVGVTLKDKFAFKVETITEEKIECAVIEENSACTTTAGGKENSETKEERRILPSSWKSLFSSSSTTSTTGIISRPTTEIKDTNTKSKRKMCPFYKRVRGKGLSNVVVAKTDYCSCRYKICCRCV